MQALLLLVLAVVIPPAGMRVEGLLAPHDGEYGVARAQFSPDLGCLIFVRLQPGTYRLALELVGEPANSTKPLGCLRETIEVLDGPRTDIECDLDPMGSLAVQLPALAAGVESKPEPARIEAVRFDDRPIDLWLRDDRDWVTMSSTSFQVAMGQTVQRRLPPGRYCIRFHHASHVAAEQITEIRQGEEAAIRFEPEPTPK